MANSTNQAVYQHQRRTLMLMCVGFFLANVLLFKVLNPLVIIIAFVIIGIRYCEVRRIIQDHPSFLNQTLAMIIICLIIFLTVKNGFKAYLVNAFINLLAGGIALKFLECKKQRDLCIQSIALFFLSSVTFVFWYDWYMVGFMLICLVCNFAVLMSLFACINTKLLLAKSLKITLIAMPLAAILFMVLPRFNPFWQMPNASQAQTGLGEEISFTDISNLIKDNSVAFRAVFKGDIPKERYFTTMVYPQLDPIKLGFMVPKGLGHYEYSLQPFTKPDMSSRPNFKREIGTVYALYMEPTNRKWLPVIDHSTSDSDQVFYTPYGTWMDKFLITQPKLYEFKYITDPFYYNRSVPLNETARKILIETGYHKTNPKTRELVQQFVNDSKGNPEVIIQYIMDYFKNNGFKYTLNPVQISANSHDIYDQFLFANRNGFCNHYSSSMTYMLRLAGIPAMTVGGFLGGEVVDSDSYVIIRNSDAHSWVSAYVDGHWQRIDPVIVLEPSRLDNAFAELTTPEIAHYTNAATYQNPVVSWFRNLFETISFKWNMTVLNYNFDNDSGFISKFFREKTILATICLILSMTVVIYLSLKIAKLFKKKEPVNAAILQFDKYTALLTKVGIERKTNTTPEQIKQKVLLKFGDGEISRLFSKTVDILNQHLYEESITEKDAANQLAKNFKQFRKLITLK